MTVERIVELPSGQSIHELGVPKARLRRWLLNKCKTPLYLGCLSVDRGDTIQVQENYLIKRTDYYIKQIAYTQNKADVYSVYEWLSSDVVEPDSL